MANLGTRKFYKSFSGNSNAEKNQIIKNSGYISIALHSVFYHSKGNFWQSTFGGIDKTILSSSITYQSANKKIEAKAIQDSRTLKGGRNHFLAISRLVALKVPASADGIELKVELSALKKDNLGNAIDLMNSEEFQVPLQLSAVPIGQILAVTNVVKKIFTGIKSKEQLEATFAGIISESAISNPIDKERLCTGYLIMISNNDEDADFLSTIDVSKLEVEGDGLKYEGKRVQHTHVVYSITFEPLRGPDENSKWFKLYEDSLEKLDDLLFTSSKAEQQKILIESRKMWIEASALLYDDPTYIAEEKKSIKASFFLKINERYAELTQDNKHTLAERFIEPKETPDFLPRMKSYDLGSVVKKTQQVSENYMKNLGRMNLIFPEK